MEPGNAINGEKEKHPKNPPVLGGFHVKLQLMILKSPEFVKKRWTGSYPPGICKAHLKVHEKKFESFFLCETDSLHLKMDGWKMGFLLGRPPTRCELLFLGEGHFKIDLLTKMLEGKDFFETLTSREFPESCDFLRIIPW